MAGPEVFFVGRHPELAHLRASLATARGGEGRFVLLSGEPGIGKTRTAAELAAQATREGDHVVWGRCHEEAGAPPYWPWSQALRACVADLDDTALRHDLGPGAPDIAEIMPVIRARLPDLELSSPARDPAEGRFRLFASLASFLIAVSRRRPHVIVLDDLHWADVPSLRFLEFLAPEIGEGRLLLIGTYRENELSRQHPLSHTLGGLTRVGHVSRLRLSGLSDDEARRFVALAAGVVPPPWLARTIQDQTEGNPLFLREVMRFLGEQGDFQAMIEGQITATPPAVRLPEGIRDVIGRRLNRLTAACNDVLALASVVGREFSLNVLAHAGAITEDVLSQALDVALDAHVIEELAPDRYQFTHVLVRMALYDELRPGERRRLHRAVGEAIEALHRRDPSPVQADLARHFQVAGRPDDLRRAVGHAVSAGRHAGSVLAFEDAIRFFETALDMIEQMAEPEPRVHADLLLRLGEMLRKINNYPAAKARLREAVTIAQASALHDILADAAFGFELADWREGHIGGGEAPAFLREVLNALPPSISTARVKVMAALVRALLYAGEREEAEALHLTTLAQARALGDPVAIIASLDLIHELGFGPIDKSRMISGTIEMTEIAERIGDLELAFRGWFQRALYHMEAGEAAESRAALKAMTSLNERIRQPVFTLFFLGLSAAFALLDGDLAEAERLILGALRVRSPGQTHASDITSVLIFDLRRAQGRLGELRPLVQAFARNSGTVAWRPGLALLQLECGDQTAAKALFDALTADNFATLPRDGRWLASIVYLAEICVALGDDARAPVLYRSLRPWSGWNLVLGGGASFPGSADRFLGILATVMAHWTDAEAHFNAALAMNERIGGLAPLAHTRYDFAAMLLTRGFPGDRDRALALLCQGRESAAALGLVALGRKIEDLLTRVPTPTQTAPDNLTARELEVLRLLAIGRGNADIAMVLSISLNTVATHVRNIFAKTGCANRTEAAAYAMRHGLHVAG